MTNKKSIFKDYLICSAGNYISQALGMVNAFLLRVFLDPAMMGIWQGLNIIKSYTSYANLGVTKSAAREIAYFRGKGDKASLEKAKNVSFSFSVLVVGGISLLIILLTLMNRNSLDPYLFWGMIAISSIVLLERVESLIVTILRAHTRFDVESIAKVLSSSAYVVLVLLIVRKFSLYGLYAANISVFLLSTGVLLGISRMRFAFSMDKNELRRLIRIGIPLVLLGFMYTNLTNVDRIVVLRMLGTEQMGLYSVSLMMGNLAYNVTNMAGIVLYPRFQEIYGRTGDAESVYAVMTRVLKVLALPLLVLTALAVFILPHAVDLFIPKYSEGIPAMRIFLWGTYFLSMSIFCRHYLVTLDKQKHSLWVIGFTVLLNLGLNVWFVKMGWGIQGVAMATASSYAVYFMLLLLLSLAMRKELLKDRGVA